MGRRAADTSNAVPALEMPLAGGRAVVSQKWGPLCSVGVQTSPGLRSLPSLKRRTQTVSMTNGTAAETMSLDRVRRCDVNGRHAVKPTSKNSTNHVSEDGAPLENEVYCQIKAVKINPKQSGTKGSLKRPPRYTNGSVVAPEVVGGVCSEGAETEEARRQSQPMIRDRRRGQSLKGEGSRPPVHCGSVSSYATPPRPCRMITAMPRLCATCGRRQSQAPPCMAPACRKRAVGHIQASMTLPTPPRKTCSPRLQKQNSTEPQPTYTQITNTQHQQTHKQNTHTGSASSQSIKKQSENNNSSTKPNQTQHKTQHTQTQASTITQPTESTTPPTSHDTHVKHDKCASTATHTPVSSVPPPCTTPKAPPLVLSIASEIKTTPTLPPKNTSNSKPVQVKSKPAPPKLLIGSEAKPTSQTPPPHSESKAETDADSKSDAKDAQPTETIPQCNGEPGFLHGLLQNVEENLLYNQEKIKVLLNVIQDLERNKAISEGRCSYRTGQDINNCSTCQKTACIIYSVEHDFRVQEVRFQSVLDALETEYEVPPPIQKPAHFRPRTKSRVKKLRKKCFWWL